MRRTGSASRSASSFGEASPIGNTAERSLAKLTPGLDTLAMRPYASGMTATGRTSFTRDEILTTEPGLAPLIAGGVRCHGGFTAEGRYRSPRALHRVPAVQAWQATLAKEGHPLLTVSTALVPPQYPNVAQAKLLLSEGVREPIVRALSMIAIVEGFGAVIRDVSVPPLAALFCEPIEGTALSHLPALFEAHARDEAGHKDEGGHKQMWEAARDLALDKPAVPSDLLLRFMGRRSSASKKAQGERGRPYPSLDNALERMLTTMANVLVIEVFAVETFDWGERLLGDPSVSADPEAASAMVARIRADEEPHVEYLRTALSEVRARTLRTEDGGTVPGRTVIDALLHETCSEITQSRQRDQQAETRAALATSMKAANKSDDLLLAFDALASPWTPPETTGFEPS